MTVTKIFGKRRQLRAKIPKKPETYPAQLGDGAGNLSVFGKLNFVYARVNGNVEEVFNNSVPSQDGLLVTVGRDPNDPERTGPFKVLSTRTTAPGGIVASSGGYAPAERYRFLGEMGGQDPLWVEQRQIMPLRVGVDGGMRVQIYPGFIWSGSQLMSIDYTIKDLVAYVPATLGHALFLMVSVNTTGTLIYTAGAEFVLASMTTAALMLANLPPIPAATADVLAYIRIYNGQTEIREGRVDTDIIDPRSAKFGLSSSHVHTLVGLSDVNIPSPTDGQPIIYNTATSKWISGPITLGNIETIAAATVIGRAVGAGTGVPTALTAAQVLTLSGAEPVIAKGDLTSSLPLSFDNIRQVIGGAAALKLGVSAADKYLYSSAADTWVEGVITAAGRALLDDVDAAAQRVTLGITSGGAGDIWVKKAGDTMTGALTNTMATGNSMVFDATTLVVDATNHRVGVGTATPTNTLDIVGSGVLGTLYAAAAGSRFQFQVGRARGTFAAPTTVVSGDAIGEFSFLAHDGTTIQQPGMIQANVDSAVSSGNVPLAFAFYTGTNSTNRLARMIISSSGNIVIGGTPSATTRLSVLGSSDIVQFAIQAHSTQTANLLETRDSSANVRNVITGLHDVGLGYVVAQGNAKLSITKSYTNATVLNYGIFSYFPITPATTVTAIQHAMIFQIRLNGSGGGSSTVTGVRCSVENNQTSGNLNLSQGFFSNLYMLGAGTQTDYRGHNSYIGIQSTGGLSGIASHFFAQSPGMSGTGVITNLVGYYAANQGHARVTTSYGLFMEPQTGSPTNYAIYTQAGLVRLGDVLLPVKTTTAAAPAYVLGGVYFDTTLNKLRVGGAAAWETVTSV